MVCTPLRSHLAHCTLLPRFSPARRDAPSCRNKQAHPRSIVLQKCVERWGREQRKAGHAESASTSVIPCPNRCPPSTLSRKDPVSGTRRVVPFVRLYFQEDVQSDGIDSSQIVEVGGSDGMVGIGAYGRRFRPRPPKEGKGKARATEPDAAEEEDEVEEELDEEVEGAASRSLKQEITRLRREAREAISAAREVPGLREQVARLKATNALLEQEVEDRDEAITSLHAEASDRDSEIEELERGQPKVKKELKEAQEELEALKATKMTLESDVSDLQLELEERTSERDDAINDAHEAKIKAGERIQALQLKLESAGTAGEEKIKRMEKEADDLNQIILE